MGGSAARYHAEFDTNRSQTIRFGVLKTLYDAALDDHRYEDAAQIWLGIPATYSGEAVEDYMRWYSGVSHRFIIPDDRREEFSAVTVVRRAVDLLEQSLEVPDALAVGTHARSLTKRALDLIRSSAFIGTQGVAFAAVRGAGAAGGRGRGGRAAGGRARGGRARGEDNEQIYSVQTQQPASKLQI
ncbi:uncharacterized protein LOC130712663 [Lotus japonicus]|uniref:uncharacterized protein LOC130712663 n=1 Tax=Lotus japonicus TaxID=34305 RepID=UPI00258EC808|nr:uncharacterized protein LOC130712663 [Lotus japonicus]